MKAAIAVLEFMPSTGFDGEEIERLERVLDRARAAW